MRTKYSICIICLLSFLLFFGCGKSSAQNKEPEVITHQLYIDVNFEGNLFLDRYDVDVVFDDQNIGTIPHGEYFTKLLSNVEEGNHTLVFHKSKDESVNGKYVIEVTNDMTFQCSIHAKGSEVKIDKINTPDSLTGASVQMIDVVDMNLEDAVNQLKEQGFVNLSYKGKDDDVIIIESNWIVISQNIESGKSFDKNERIILICKHNTELEEEEASSETTQSYAEEAIENDDQKIEQEADIGSSFTTGVLTNLWYFLRPA